MLEPKASVNRVDSEHCVTATVTAGGEPVAGVEVRFTVTGANQASGVEVTDAQGRATFCYTGDNAGPDVIRAFADTDGDATEDAGEPGDAATKLFVLPPPQHYKCYQLALPRSGDDDDDDKRGGGAQATVGLSDQFGDGRAKVFKARQLCNPAEKTAGGQVFPIAQREAHLVSYRIARTGRRIRSRRVELSDQFGTLIRTVRRPDRLLTPSAKAIPPGQPGPIPTRLDHYQCYPLRGDDDDDSRFRRRSVTLSDQFGSGRVTVVEPLALCNPVEKHHAAVFPIQQPDEHLTCYAIRAGRFTARPVRVLNQFGSTRLRVLTPRTLCVPSKKRELPPWAAMTTTSYFRGK